MSFKPDFSNALHQRKTNITETLHEASTSVMHNQMTASFHVMDTSSAASTSLGASNQAGPSTIIREYQHRGQPAYTRPSTSVLKKDNQISFGRRSHIFLHGRKELFDAQIRNNLGPLRRLLLGDGPPPAVPAQMTQQLPESTSLVPDPDLANLTYPDDDEEQEVAAAILASPAMSFDAEKSSGSTIPSPIGQATNFPSAELVHKYSRDLSNVSAHDTTLRHETPERYNQESLPTCSSTSPYHPPAHIHTPSPSPSPPPSSYFPFPGEAQQEQASIPYTLPSTPTTSLPQSPLFKHHHASAEVIEKVPSPLPSQDIVNPRHMNRKRKGSKDVEKESPKAKKPKVSKSILSGRDNTQLRKPNQPHRPDLYDDLPQWKSLFDDPVLDKENQTEVEEPTVLVLKEHMKVDVDISHESPSKFSNVPTAVEDDHSPTFDEPEVVDEGFWESPQFAHVDVGESTVQQSERHISPLPADADAPTSSDRVPSLVAKQLEQDVPSSPTFATIPISTIELPDLDFFFDERGPAIAVLHENDGVSTETSHLSLSQEPPRPDEDVAPSSPIASSSSLAPSSPVVPGPSPRKVLQSVPMATLLSWKAGLATIHEKGQTGNLKESDRRNARDILRLIVKQRYKIVASSLAESDLEAVVRSYVGKYAVQGEDMLKNAKLLMSHFEKVLKQNTS